MRRPPCRSLPLLWPLCLAAAAAAQKVPDARADDVAGGAESSGAVLAASDRGVFTAWLENRGGGRGVYFDRSGNGGARWNVDRRIDNAPPGIACSGVQIAADDNAVYVVWVDARNGRGDVFCNRALDGG